MALSVQVESEDGSAPKLVFDLPRIVIGRGENSDVRLPDPSVSQRHATIRQRGTDYIVLDEGSTNGTFAGPVKLSAGAPRLLKTGDRLRFGRVWATVAIEGAANCSTPQETRELALRLVAGSLQAEGQPCAPEISVSAGPDLGVALTLGQFQHLYSIGRSPECELALSDEDLSRRHLQVRRLGSEVLVKDLSSKNGSILADMPLKKEQRWFPGQVLRAGQTQLSLLDPLQETLAKIDAAADEVLQGQAEMHTPAPEAVHAPSEGGAAESFESEPAARRADSEGPQRSAAPAARRSGTWSGVDVLVALVALTVLGVSVAGFFWLLSTN
jgi:pSer/pThr/pTyr-binding forkhead associated (FHA) protein